jgi:hypothetical protein
VQLPESGPPAFPLQALRRGEGYGLAVTPTDRAIEEIRKRRSVRTPILAALLDMEDAEVDALLAEPLGRGALIGCDVQVGEVKVKEYRCSMTGGGRTHDSLPEEGRQCTDPVKARLAEWGRNPSIGQASADVAQSAPSRPAAPAPVDSPKEEPMQGTIIERALAALKKHEELSLSALAQARRHLEASMSTYTGTLMKKHGVSRIVGKRGVYMLGAVQRQAPSALPVSGSPYASALADLRTKREAMALDLTKLDSAISAIEALG